jgi:hypothetical protein
MEAFCWILRWFSCFKCFHALQNLRRTGKAAAAASFRIAATEFPTLIKAPIVEGGYIPKYVLTSMYKPLSYLQRDADGPTFLDFCKQKNSKMKKKKGIVPNIKAS